MFTGCKIINTSFKHAIVALLLIVQHLKNHNNKILKNKKKENHLLQKFQGPACGLYYTEILNIWVLKNKDQAPNLA